MKEINLTKGYKTIVDDEDYNSLAKNKWCISISNPVKKYAMSWSGKEKKFIKLHRILMNCPSNMVVDHINGDPLDNRKSNLRMCTLSQNLVNKKVHKRSKSGLKGVWKVKSGNYVAQLRTRGKARHLGTFKTKEAAYKVFCEESMKLHGEYVNL